MPTPDEIRLAAMLAGSLNKDLEGTVGHKRIDASTIMRNIGPTPKEAGVMDWSKRKEASNNLKIPGLIENPRSTPTGSEIIGTSTELPDLIPIPPELEKYAKEYIKEIHSIPEKSEPQLIIEPAPYPVKQTLSPIQQILDDLKKIKDFLGIKNEEDSNTLLTLIQENAKSKRKKRTRSVVSEEDNFTKTITEEPSAGTIFISGSGSNY